MRRNDNVANQQKNKMEDKPILYLILTMSIPPLLSMFMQYSYNFVDCIFVSWISEDALAAASLSFPLTTLMIAISIGLGVGINVLVSRKLGEKEQDEANSVVSHGLILSSVLGIILVFVFHLVSKPYFAFFIKDEKIYKLALDYMNICVFLQFPNMVHIAIQKIIQATGNMVAPMLFQIAGVLFNCIFDPILIFGWGPFPKMGIKGAALATVLGYVLSMILAFYVLIFRNQKVKIKTKNFHIDFSIFTQIFRLGLPSFVMNALSAFMASFVNIFLVAYSTTAVAFFGAYFKAQQMVVMTVNGLIQGCIPLMSFNFGAKNIKRLNETFKYGVRIAIILMGVGGIILAIFPKEILRVFRASDQMLELGVPGLRIMTLSYIFNGISTMVASYMQSINKVKISLLINLMRQLLFLVPSLFILDKLFGINGIWSSFIVAEFLTFVVSIYYYKKERIE